MAGVVDVRAFTASKPVPAGERFFFPPLPLLPPFSPALFAVLFVGVPACWCLRADFIACRAAPTGDEPLFGRLSSVGPSVLGSATKAGEDTDLEKRTGDATIGLSLASIFLPPKSSVAAVITGAALTVAPEITSFVCGGGNGGPTGVVCFPKEFDREESLDGGRGGASKAKGTNASFDMFEEDERPSRLCGLLLSLEGGRGGASSSPGRYTACADMIAGETTVSCGSVA